MIISNSWLIFDRTPTVINQSSKNDSKSLNVQSTVETYLNEKFNWLAV